MAKKSLKGPGGAEEPPTEPILKTAAEEQPTERKGREKPGKRIIRLQEQEDAATVSMITRLRKEVGSPEKKISGESETEWEKTMPNAVEETLAEESPTGKVLPELQAELIEKSAEEEEPVKFIEEKKLSDAEVRENFLNELEEKIKFATKKTISLEKLMAIEAANTFLEKLGLILEAYETNKIKSVSRKEGIFRVIKIILEEVHRQDAMAVVNTSEGKLTKENLQKLEGLEKKYETLQEKIRTYLNVEDAEDSEAASSGVKLVLPGKEGAAEEKFSPPVEEDITIRQERSLVSLSDRLMMISKGERLSGKKFDEMASQDISFGNKIKNLLNQIIGDERIKTIPLREKIKIFMDVSQALSEETAAEMVDAGADLKEKIGAISTAYNSDSLEIFEHLGLGKWVEDKPDKNGRKRGHIEYAEGVNIRFEE